jgi:hypothetical protein
MRGEMIFLRLSSRPEAGCFCPPEWRDLRFAGSGILRKDSRSFDCVRTLRVLTSLRMTNENGDAAFRLAIKSEVFLGGYR